MDKGTFRCELEDGIACRYVSSRQHPLADRKGCSFATTIFNKKSVYVCRAWSLCFLNSSPRVGFNSLAQCSACNWKRDWVCATKVSTVMAQLAMERIKGTNAKDKTNEWSLFACVQDMMYALSVSILQFFHFYSYLYIPDTNNSLCYDLFRDFYRSSRFKFGLAENINWEEVNHNVSLIGSTWVHRISYSGPRQCFRQQQKVKVSESVTGETCNCQTIFLLRCLARNCLVAIYLVAAGNTKANNTLISERCTEGTVCYDKA
jgi:hypothetical protein